MSLLDKIAPYRKAVAGFLVPALVALGAALVDGEVTAVEWVAIVLAGLGTGGVVYGVRNAPAPWPSSTSFEAGGAPPAGWSAPPGSTKHDPNDPL